MEVCITWNLHAQQQAWTKQFKLYKPTAPIFSGIHIIAAENILYVQAMDLNMAISCTVESNTEANGEIVVSAKHFSELMRKLPGETVTIIKNKEEKTISVKSAKSDFQLLLIFP